MRSAVESLREALGAMSKRPALRVPGRSLDYAELLAAIEERMVQLARLGARRVALALDNGADWVTWDLALLFSGRVCVPVPGFFSPAQQRHVLESAGVDTLVGTPAPGMQAHGFTAWQPGIWQRQPLRVPALPTGTLKVTYTSGTTAAPKGVCLDGDTLLAVAESLRQATEACGIERHACVLPLSTLLENVAGVYAPFLEGACVTLAPLAEIGFHGASGLDLPRLLAFLHQAQPHSVIMVPQLLLALVMAAERGVPMPGTLRFLAVGGGRVAPQLLKRAEAVGLPVYEGYGLSECASVVCLNTPQARRIGTVGRPLPHVALRLAEDGEVLVRGSAMHGYVGGIQHHGEWLATGDLAHFEEGFLVLHGRKKHQFITAFGRNVNPEWVEAELTQQPAIAQAWVHGEALACNVAVVVARDPQCSDETLAAAIAAANAELPDYAQTHAWIRAAEPFSARNGLATDNGRLCRSALLTHYGPAIDALTVSSTHASEENHS